METEIDGNNSLAGLESALLLKEAAANELTALSNNGNENDPKTHATFQKLGPGKRPKPLHLIKSDDTPPSGTTFVCSGTVFISGQTAAVSAFRDNK